MEAQQNKFAGEYYFRGVMETASGFSLEADSSFQFFFSYGALNREGKGTLVVKNDHAAAMILLKINNRTGGYQYAGIFIKKFPG